MMWTSAVLLSCYAMQIATAHVAMTNPAARQVVNGVGLIQRSYTTFGSFGDIYGNNANVFGGPDGPKQLAAYGYGLCGDDGRRRAFSIPSSYGYAPTAPQMTIAAGEVFEVTLKFTTHHLGWVEFRLCVPRPGETVVTADTAECFRENVLRLAPDQYYTAADMPTGIRSVFDWEGTPEAGYIYHHAKCQQGPPNTCCDADSGCSPENANVHRFVLPRAGIDNNVFRVRLIAPTGVACDRCTLQMTYRTGNSPDNFPETFWNCADISVRDNLGGTRAPTTAAPPTASKTPTTTKAPTMLATKTPSISSKAPTPLPSMSKAPSASTGGACAGTWQQCGGIGFSGKTCCASSADACVVTNDYWSMCTPRTSIGTKAPSRQTLRPTVSPSKAGCGKTWEQCGGNGFTGNKCCASAADACVFENEWWSMCRPRQ